MQFLLKPLGNLDIFDPFPTVASSLPFRLHVAHLSVKALILDEETTSNCSNGCIKSMPTLRRNLPALTQSNCYGLFLCAVPPRQRRASNQPDGLEVFQLNQQLTPLKLDWWAVDEKKTV